MTMRFASLPSSLRRDTAPAAAADMPVHRNIVGSRPELSLRLRVFLSAAKALA
jgi:hypothetical protein